VTLVAVLRAGSEKLSVEIAAVPPLGRSDVRVRVLASGVCGTDLRTLAGSSTMTGLPIVLGHEVAGVVIEVGAAVTRVKEGDTVIASFSSSCGHCWFCVRNETHLCANYQATRSSRRVELADGTEALVAAGIGAFAEEIAISENTVIAVAPILPAEQLCLIGCSVATGVGSVSRAADVQAGSSVAVFGCGGVGHFVVQGSRMVGATRIIAIDPSRAKREAALKAGATDAVDPASTDPVDAVHELTDGRGADYAFEVSGRVDVLRQSYAATRRGGTVTVVGFPPDGSVFELDAASIFRDAKRLVGSYYGNIRFREDFPTLVELARAGRLDLGAAISDRFPLDRVNDAIELLRSGDVVRAVLL
jgi:S-(hydroxymethyl)glutathione dehydrogenase / alcohol dehydrogenase